MSIKITREYFDEAERFDLEPHYPRNILIRFPKGRCGVMKTPFNEDEVGLICEALNCLKTSQALTEPEVSDG